MKTTDNSYNSKTHPTSTLKGELALIICYPRSSENGLSLLVNFAFLMVLTLLAVCRFHSKDGISPSLLWLALESFLLSLSAVTISSAVSISSSIMSLMLHSYQQNLFQSQKKLATHTQITYSHLSLDFVSFQTNIQNLFKMKLCFQ